MNEQKDKQTYLSVDGTGTTENEQTEELFESGGERPLIVLKPNIESRKTDIMCRWIFIILFVGFTFWVFMPAFKIFMSGNYEQLFMGGKYSILRGLLFGIPTILIIMPLFIFVLNQGPYFFYNDRLEVLWTWGVRKIVIPYKQMYVLRHGSGRGGILITKQSLPRWSNPLKRYHVEVWDGIRIPEYFPPPQKVAGIATSWKVGWENPEDVPRVIKILKEKAFEFKEI